jgi:hypothetical protein
MVYMGFCVRRRAVQLDTIVLGSSNQENETPKRIRIRGKGIGSGRHDPDKQPIDETTDSFLNFVRKFKNSPHTKKSYITLLRRYVKYCNSPDVRRKIGIEVNDNTDLLLFENYNSDKEDRARFLKNLITHYLDHLSDIGIAPTTLHSYYTAVKHFYVKNEVQFKLGQHKGLYWYTLEYN